MGTTLQNIKNLSILSITSFLGLSLTSCSTSQQYIDTDGIYNAEKYKPVETYENNKYYTKYFEEKTADAKHFIDIENYTSYAEGSPGWGDISSNVTLNNDSFYGGWNTGFGWGWNSPWNMGFGWGWNSPWNMGLGWGWNSPWYMGYGWGIPYYGWGNNFYANRNISYASNYRNNNIRTVTPALRTSTTRNLSRQLNNTTLANTRNIQNARVSEPVRSDRSLQNNRSNQFNTRNQNINTRNNTRETNYNRSAPTMRQSTPSSGRSFGGGFNGSGGGRSFGGGRR